MIILVIKFYKNKKKRRPNEVFELIKGEYIQKKKYKPII